MIELTFKADDYGLKEEDLKAILSWRDYSSAIWSMKELLMVFHDCFGTYGADGDEVSDFYKRACALLSGLPL